MKKKIVAATCILVALLLSWLICSDVIMSALLHNAVPKTTSFDNWQISPYAKAVLETAYSNGNDLFETISLSGWAFAETEEDNSNRNVSLILKNGSLCYEVPLTRDWAEADRFDVIKAFPDFKIYSGNIGWYCTIVTYPIKDGIYDAYLYCWENENSYGMSHTGQQFVKDGSNTSFRTWESTETVLTEYLEEKLTVQQHIDAFVIENKMLTIIGWAFQPELDCEEQTVYFKVNGKTYTTLPISRPGVANAYGSNLYIFSGFQAYVPAENLPAGESEIQIFIENDGTFYSGEPIPVIRNGDEVQIKKAVSPPSWQSEAITLGSQPMEGETVKSYIDSFTVEDGMVSISGWGFQPELDSGTQKVYFYLNGTAYTTERRSRKDVANAYQNDLYAVSGFHALIPAEKFPEGESEIQILIENNGELYSSRFASIIRSSNEIQKKS